MAYHHSGVLFVEVACGCHLLAPSYVCGSII